jgi:hypothetical protein
VSAIDLAAQRERSRSSMALERSAQRADFLPRSVGNAAWLALGEAIIGWIAGLDEDEVRPVIERAREWLEDSVERGEEFGVPPSYFAVVRMEALAVACWLTGEPAAPRFAAAVALHEQAFADLQPLSDEQMRADYLPDYVRDCCLAKEFERGAAAYAAPADEQDVATPLELAAWICAHRDFRPETAARVLHDPLVEWLSHGEGVTAAAWIKLVFCDFGPERNPGDAFRVVRKFVS